MKAGQLVGTWRSVQSREVRERKRRMEERTEDEEIGTEWWR